MFAVKIKQSAETLSCQRKCAVACRCDRTSGETGNWGCWRLFKWQVLIGLWACVRAYVCVCVHVEGASIMYRTNYLYRSSKVLTKTTCIKLADELRAKECRFAKNRKGGRLFQDLVTFGSLRNRDLWEKHRYLLLWVSHFLSPAWLVVTADP